MKLEAAFFEGLEELPKRGHEQTMTSIADYIESIRQSLAVIEQETDATREPESYAVRRFRAIDSAACELAGLYRLYRGGRGKRVAEEAGR